MGKQKSGKLPVEISIRDVGYLDDLEQASTTFLASWKVQDAVKEHTLSGIEFYLPLGYAINTKKKNVIKMLEECQVMMKYLVMHVSGSGGSIARASGMKLKSKCESCGWENWSPPKRGIIVDEAQWDGSDFFFVDEFGAWLMSEKAVESLSAAGLSNFGAKLASEHRPTW